MKIVGRRGGQKGKRARLNRLRFEMNHTVLVLHNTFDEQERLARHEQPLLLKNLRCEDDVGDPGFVFETQKNKSFRSARSLPADYIAGQPEPRAGPRLREISSSPDIWQMRTNQRERMRAGGQVRSAIIRLRPFKGIHRQER